jgi:hypothetical protein
MTTNQLLRLVEECHMGFKKGQTTAALFLDAEAAFDKCWHDGVRYKLHEQLKLPTRHIRLLSSFLQDRKLQVYDGEHSSTIISLGAGTPQGSCLSPLIYIISVNDMPDGAKHGVSQSQYADDTWIYGSARTDMEAVRKVQKAVNDVEAWCRKWRLRLNGDKLQLVLISRARKKSDEHLCILLFDDVVRPVPTAKFLGVLIDKRLNFKEHLVDIEQRERNRLNVLKALA